MNIIQLLKERITTELHNKPRTVVFWYDEQGEYTVEALTEALADQPIHVRELTRNNFFSLKIEIEVEKKNESFLLYAHFAKPEKEQNYLLDMELYGTEFKADTTALFAEQLQVSDAMLRSVMSKYPEFFKSAERKEKLKKVLKLNANEHDFECAMLAVLTGAPIAEMNKIAQHLLTAGLQEESNDLYQSIVKRFSKEQLFTLLGQHFGVHVEQYTLQHLMAHIVYAHFQRYAQFEDATLQQKYETTRANVSALFVDDWLQSKGRHVLEQYIRDIEEQLEIVSLLQHRPMEHYADIATFPVIDVLLIEKLTTELLHQTSNLTIWKEVLQNRLKMHWANENERVRGLLQVLVHAVDFTIHKTLVKQYDTRIPLYVQYADKLYVIDQTYRRFMLGYMQLDQRELLDELAQKCTNWYEHKYLSKIAEETNYTLTQAETGKLPKQATFYAEYIQPIMEKESTRVFVIISDALRFEAGAELAKQLDARANGSATISPLVANMPTYTQLGMASLLPHRTLSISSNGTVLADDESTKGLENRMNILRKFEPESVAFRYDDIISWSRATADEQLKGKRLVYVYHDVIDATGDTVKSERETYAAVERAIQQVSKLVDLLSRWQVKRIFITADHGFLYQNSKIENAEKVASVVGEKFDSNRRFIIGDQLSIGDGAIEVPASFTTLQGAQKAIAKGINRFIGGGGLQFVHGGATPQEAITPLIDYRRTTQAALVDVNVAMPSRVIKNMRVEVPLYQEQSISTEFTAHTIRLAFYLDGERISNEVEHTFNMQGQNHERTTTFTFDLTERHYRTGQTCTLKMMTVEGNKVIPYSEAEFTLHMYSALY
ncbi:BREX-1 system phosphatase PglZ type A [Caryophanon latum]|uniref:TIGR02687 family protein n=1 Tax=Caryophanon latum TaxID=33977 RepID=A0A1C0YX40_9BACL|nr:BREX-1 system phosphatase PglZ type A [Caryophanon latum]OCS91704.1 TIGR02687 family protein [Caryophanon latum]